MNITCVGFFAYVFTSPDTFKSISTTIACLSINSVVYEYSILVFLQYIAIHILSGFIAGIVSVGIYNGLISNITTERLLNHIFPSKRAYDFDYSFVLVAIMVHIGLAIGLTLITNMTTSINARSRTIHKAMFIFFVSIIFGIVVGPIGSTLPNLCLYITIAIVRNDYSSVDEHILIVQSCSILSMLILYPFVAIQIKFVWRNKYRRYIEYGM